MFLEVFSVSVFSVWIMCNATGPWRQTKRKRGKKSSSIIPWASQNVAQTLPGASEGSDVLLHNRAEENSPETLINESSDGLSTAHRPLSLHLMRLQVKNLLMVHIMALKKAAREKET